MSFFGNLFGRKPTPALLPELTPPPATPPPPGAAPMMQLRDAQGRMVEIPREEWRTKILPYNFQKAWNLPDELAGLIEPALNDGFVADSLEPARQLHRIDSNPRRGAVFLGVVLLLLKRFDEAGKFIAESIQRHGEDAVLLTNLARAQHGLGDAALAERTLWHALELDPNYSFGIGWFEAVSRERGGDAAALEARRRVAALPGSWWVQLSLAHAALESRNLDQAVALHEESLARAGSPAPAGLLQKISGDLGNFGHLPELLRLTEPHFVAATHGLAVGNNLIKAHLDLGQLDAARQILDQLYELKQPEWRNDLGFWDTAIAKAHAELATTTDAQKPIEMTMLSIQGPVWLNPDSPAAELFPVRSADGLAKALICFLGSTAEIASNSKRPQHQLSDTPGRLSRAVPLFLAEQVEFASDARVQTLVPWMVGEAPAFVFSGVAWTDETAANCARRGDAKADYVVVTHLKPVTEPWTVELRLVRTIDATCVGTLSATFTMPNPEEGLPGLARQLLALLKKEAGVQTVSPPPLSYHVPAAPHFANYLLRLEQLLAVRCGGMDGVPRAFLNGEREIIEGNLQLCLDHPQNVSVRILLAQTLAGIKRVRPAIPSEFAEKIASLQKEKPLPEPAQGIVQRLLNDVLAG